MKEWCDIQDQDGFWKIGYVIDKGQNNIMQIRIDGFHPGSDTFYCNHSNKLFPIRQYTMGLNTYAQGHKVLREPLNLEQIKLNHNRLTLVSRMQNLLESTEQNIKIFLRTELLTLVDKIIRTPFLLLNSMKMCDLWINKLFIGVMNFYLKMLDSSKKFIPLLNSDHRMADQLFIAMYEFSIVAKIIIGSHKSSKTFFQDQANLTIKSDGFIDCFIKSENGILPFKMFFKNLSLISVASLKQKQVSSIFEIIQFFLDLCDRSKGELFQSDFFPQTKNVIDEIISFLKLFATHQENLKEIRLRVETICRLETLQLKIRPKRVHSIRIQLLEKKMIPQRQSLPQQQKSSGPQQPAQDIKSLQERVSKLQQLLGNVQVQATSLSQNPKEWSQNQRISHQNNLLERTKNLGQQQFLNSLNWALTCGDLQTCKKLVSWRQNLLRLGRIVGWETALQVGVRTMKKAQITYEDIISVSTAQIQKSAHITNSRNSKTVEPQYSRNEKSLLKNQKQNKMIAQKD